MSKLTKFYIATMLIICMGMMVRIVIDLKSHEGHTHERH